MKKLINTFAGVQTVIQSSIYAAQRKVAPKLLYDAVSRRRFNSYTGAMAYAYGAILVVNGQTVGTLQLQDGDIDVKPPHQSIQTSKNGKKFAYIQGRRENGSGAHGSPYEKVRKRLSRKGIRGRKSQIYFTRKRRYPRKHEFLRTNMGGFHYNTSFINGYSFGGFGTGPSRVSSINPTGASNKKNYIQLINASSYAAMVQARGYNVLGSAYVRGRGRYARHLSLTVTDEILKKALHNYKKLIRSDKGYDGSAIYKLIRYDYDD